MYMYTYVVGYEKRNHFVQNMIFCHLHVQMDSQWFPRRSPKSPLVIGYIFTALGIPETVTFQGLKSTRVFHLVCRQFGPSTSQIQRQMLAVNFKHSWHQYSSIILLHLLGILSPAHFQCGRASDYVNCVQNSPFQPHFSGSLLGTGGLFYYSF